MAEFKEIKEAALVEAILKGPGALRQLDLPKRVIKRWTRMLGEPLTEPLNPVRWVNHFKVGGDPEFGIVNAAGQRIEATKLGLKTGAAFGADLNGRIAELRCHASRSTFEVTAGTLATLRWFGLSAMPARGKLYASALFGADGLGGHVHFGRKKRVLRVGEVAALDNVTEILTERMPIFDPTLVSARRRDTHYGRYGDTRPQAHGYEYRALPTWLASPWHAFFTLTLAKLAVYKPRLFCDLPQGITAEIVGALFGFFQNQDEDARLAFCALKVHGIPDWHGEGKVSEAWGLLGSLQKAVEVPSYFPSVIAPSPIERTDLLAYLTKKTPLPWRVGGPTWTPTQVPKGYRLLLSDTPTAGYKQLGEIVQGFCVGERDPLTVMASGDRGLTIKISRNLWTRDMSKRAREFFPPEVSLNIDPERNACIRIGQGLREDNRYLPMLRKFLSSGLFPVWSITKITGPPAKIQLRGLVLYNELTELRKAKSQREGA